jgi:hypothetical protein
MKGKHTLVMSCIAIRVAHSVLGYGLNERELDIRFPTASIPALVPSTTGLYFGVKRPGSSYDCVSITARLKNPANIPPLPPISWRDYLKRRAISSIYVPLRKYQGLHYYSSDVDLLCGLMVRVPGYRSRGPVSILGATRFSEK